MVFYKDKEGNTHCIDEGFESLLPVGCYLIDPPIQQPPTLPTLDQIKVTLCANIDQKADMARLKIAGDPLRVVEYERAASESEAFRAAGYTGEVPPTVLSWSEAKGWTAQQAADDILAVSTAWNTALYFLRDVRLKGKEAVKAATDEATATIAAETVFGQIAAALAGMGI